MDLTAQVHSTNSRSNSTHVQNFARTNFPNEFRVHITPGHAKVCKTVAELDFKYTPVAVNWFGFTLCVDVAKRQQAIHLIIVCAHFVSTHLDD